MRFCRNICGVAFDDSRGVAPAIPRVEAIEKLEFVHSLMEEAKTIRPKVSRGRRISEARKLRRTLSRYLHGEAQALCGRLP